MRDSDRFKDFLSYIRETNPQIKRVDDAWKRNEEYIREALEKVHKLEMVSGYSIDSLISLFAAGWKLKAPEVTIPPLCLSPLLKEKESEKFMEAINRDTLKDIDAKKFADEFSHEYILLSDTIKKILDIEEE